MKMQTVRDYYIYIILFLQFLILLYFYCKKDNVSYDTYNTTISTKIDFDIITNNFYYKLDTITQDGTLIKGN